MKTLIRIRIKINSHVDCGLQLSRIAYIYTIKCKKVQSYCNILMINPTIVLSKVKI